MSRFIVLLGLLVAVVAVYGGDMNRCTGTNESWHECGSHCEPTCEHPLGEPCPKRTPCNEETAGCRCNSGYVRDTRDNSCIRQEHCKKNESQ